MSEAVAAPPPVPPSAGTRGRARAVWSERLTRFSFSGLSAAQFCAREGVSLPTFYGWKRRLAAEAKDATAHDPSRDVPPHLLPVQLQPFAPAVELVLTSGAILRLPPGCDLTWVRSLVTALGGPSC